MASEICVKLFGCGEAEHQGLSMEGSKASPFMVDDRTVEGEGGGEGQASINLLPLKKPHHLNSPPPQ